MPQITTAASLRVSAANFRRLAKDHIEAGSLQIAAKMTEVAADFETQAMAVDEREQRRDSWEQTLVAPDARKSILVLDEEDGFRRFLVAALTDVGYSVVDTSNSNQAITLLNGDVAFDLLIADVKMPSRQPHGVAVGNIARLKRSQIKIIYVSGNPGHVPSGLIDIAETPLLGKPITLKTLMSAVEAALVAPR